MRYRHTTRGLTTARADFTNTGVRCRRTICARTCGRITDEVERVSRRLCKLTAIGAGISVGEASTRSKRALAIIVGAALGGAIVGAAVEWLGRWSLAALVG